MKLILVSLLFTAVRIILGITIRTIARLLGWIIGGTCGLIMRGFSALKPASQ